MDSTGLDILSKLVRLGQRKQVCLQWIPSHAGVPENEAADELADSEKHSEKIQRYVPDPRPEYQIWPVKNFC
ncbi:hypothetical protein TNCV_2334671 [Trichonephila clavipes]|nr:hypothetical protein TNCV_2334671 [Trichonephila clavipes]